MREPQRTCVVCRKIADKKELLRVVRSKEGMIELDLTGRKNGRGAYLCKEESCFEKLKKSKGLDRSFKTSVPEAVYERLLNEVIVLKEG